MRDRAVVESRAISPPIELLRGSGPVGVCGMNVMILDRGMSLRINATLCLRLVGTAPVAPEVAAGRRR